MTTSIKTFEWHEPARESAALFGLSEQDVESIARNPSSIMPDPSMAVREWRAERRTTADVTVIVAFPESGDPIIWGVYLNLDLPVGKNHAKGGGGQSIAPRSMRNLRERIISAGLHIRAGSKHDLVYDDHGNTVATLPRTPSDHRAVPNAWVAIRKKGYPV